LRDVQLPDGRRARYTYDAFGRRVRKVIVPREQADLVEAVARLGAPEEDEAVEPDVTEFFYDGDELCCERLPDGELRQHVHHPGTFIPLLMKQAGRVYSVICDYLGTPTMLVGDAGEVVWSASYTAWGVVAEVKRDMDSHVETPFRLLGQYHDAETGQCYTRFRYFDPITGRFTSPEPLGIPGGPNLFALDGAPTDVLDPLGLCARRRPMFQQEEKDSCGIAAARMIIASKTGKDVAEATLRSQSGDMEGGWASGKGTHMESLPELLRQHGVDAGDMKNVTVAELQQMTDNGNNPALVHIQHAEQPGSGPGAHFIVVDEVVTMPDGTRVLHIRDPDGNMRAMTEDQFNNDYYGNGTGTKGTGWTIPT
jgi:RHS repeat-associated protein